MHAIPATSGWEPAQRVLHCAGGGACTRPERELRALECLLAAPRARTRVEGQGRGAREPRAASALVGLDVHAPACDPARDLRAGPTRGHEAHLAARALRPHGWKCVYCGTEGN